MALPSLLNSPRLTLAEAARILRVHVSTVHRWNQRGLRGRKLRVIRIGGRSYVLRDDLERWVAASSDPPSAPDQASDFARRAADANRACDALGL